MPLNLVGDYSDSGGEEEESATSNEEEWQECFDDSSGYPYFWNVKTNEVSWEKPQSLCSKPPPSKSVSSPHASNGNSLPKEKAKKTGAVVYGPSLSSGEPSTPEEIAISRIRKFENDLADGIIKDINKESPSDWKDSKPSSVLYESTFKWNKLQPIFPTLEAKEKVKASKNAIALIGGVYGDADDDDEDDSNQEDEPEEETLPPVKKRKISVTVKVPQNKVSTLKPVPNAFLDCNKNEESSSKNTRPKSAGSLYKKSIDSIAETLCDKLEALKVANIFITPLKLLAVQIDTLFAAWQSGALSSSYLQRTLTDMNKKMSAIESNELAPPGWKTIWDSATKAYIYENLITGEVQSEKPQEDEDEEDVPEIVKEKASTNEPEILQIDSDEENPPLPKKAQQEVEILLPPLPPDPPPVETLPPPPPPPPPEGQVQDMDLDEDEVTAGGSNGHLDKETSISSHMDSALSSFYKDLASIDKGSDSNSPIVSPSISPSPNDVGRENSPSEMDMDEKKKRKTKISALTLKKKGVSNLVAKWNNLQEQAKNSK